MRLARILVSSFLFLDSPTSDGALKDNSGHDTRLKYVRSNETVELYGRLDADLFNSCKMLINGVDMNIKLTRAPEAFYLREPSDDTEVCIKILDITFLSLMSNWSHLFF
jgi:hypothetical protein